MITDSLIRKKFVHETITQGMDAIFSTMEQRLVATFEQRTGRLRHLIASRPMERHITDTRYEVVVSLYTYLRFLDMQYRRQNDSKKRQKGLVYNKVVWPIVYRELLPELRYGLTDEVRRQLRSQLEAAFAPK